MNSQKLRQHAQGLQGSAPGPLYIYYNFHFTVFREFLSGRTNGSLIVVHSLGLFSSVCLFLSNTDVIIWLYQIVFCPVIFYYSSLEVSLFSNETEHGWICVGGEVRWNKVKRERNFYMKKNLYFHQKEIEMKRYCETNGKIFIIHMFSK